MTNFNELQFYEDLTDNEDLDISDLPYDVKEKLYYDFFFNISDFLYDIWNLKVIDYDGELSNNTNIKTEILEKNDMLHKNTIKDQLVHLTLDEQLEKLFFDEKDFSSKFKFYINYIKVHNDYKNIKTKKLLEFEYELEELSLFFEKKI